MPAIFVVLGVLLGLAALSVRPIARLVETLDDPYFDEGNMQ